MATRTCGIGISSAPGSERRIRLAASLTKQTLSAFMLEAASERAERVISESRHTVAPPAFFDALWRSMDEPPGADKQLRRVANRPRRVRQQR